MRDMTARADAGDGAGPGANASRRKDRELVALPGEEYARGGIDRSLYRISRRLRRPAFCVSAFSGPEGVSLSDRAGTGTDAAVSPQVPASGARRQARQSRRRGGDG